MLSNSKQDFRNAEATGCAKKTQTFAKFQKIAISILSLTVMPLLQCIPKNLNTGAQLHFFLYLMASKVCFTLVLVCILLANI